MRPTLIGMPVPAVRTGSYIYVSGQVPVADGKIAATGKVGAEVSAEDAAGLARICALSALAAAADVAGGLENISRIVKVVGFVASAPGFNGQPQVINGASELLIEVLGEDGRHARSAIGVAERALEMASATTHVVVDTPKSSVLDVRENTYDFEAMTNRAVLVGNVIANGAVREAIANRAHVAVGAFGLDAIVPGV